MIELSKIRKKCSIKITIFGSRTQIGIPNVRRNIVEKIISQCALEKAQGTDVDGHKLGVLKEPHPHL